MCVHTPQLNRWTDRQENWPKNSESNTGAIRGFTDCHIVDLAAESPRIEFSLENSRYSRRISRGDRKKFATKISLSQKAARNFAFNYFERTNLRSGSPHIYCTVRDRIRKSNAAPRDKKFLRSSYFRDATEIDRPFCESTRLDCALLGNFSSTCCASRSNRWWHGSYLGIPRMQKSTRLLLHHSVPGNPPPRGGGWRVGAAAGVFQIITSGCGGGGSPWQPQCLQHPTTEGNRATERRNPVLLLRTSGARANRNGRKRFPRRTSTSVRTPSLMELNKQPRIGNPRMYFPRFFRDLPNKIPSLRDYFISP